MKITGMLFGAVLTMNFLITGTADAKTSTVSKSIRSGYSQFLHCYGYTQFRLFLKSRHPELNEKLSNSDADLFRHAAMWDGQDYGESKVQSDLRKAGDAYAAGAKGKGWSGYDRDGQTCYSRAMIRSAVAAEMSWEQSRR